MIFFQIWTACSVIFYNYFKKTDIFEEKCNCLSKVKYWKSSFSKNDIFVYNYQQP